jgi:hypothetical protein
LPAEPGAYDAWEARSRPEPETYICGPEAGGEVGARVGRPIST